MLAFKNTCYLWNRLKEKVARKTLSESDARLKLAGKLSELKALQDNQDAMQQQLDYQRAAQNRGGSKAVPS